MNLRWKIRKSILPQLPIMFIHIIACSKFSKGILNFNRGNFTSKETILFPWSSVLFTKFKRFENVLKRLTYFLKNYNNKIKTFGSFFFQLKQWNSIYTNKKDFDNKSVHWFTDVLWIVSFFHRQHHCRP